jgi:hypothetical protein
MARVLELYRMPALDAQMDAEGTFALYFRYPMRLAKIWQTYWELAAVDCGRIRLSC